MQHAILYGEHELVLDEKNRLLVPAEIRRSLDSQRDGEAFFMVVGQNRKLWFYPDRYYERLIAQSQSEIAPDDDLLAFDQMYFARASRVEWDKQGRLVIPEKSLRRTGVEREVTLIGVRDHLELWNRAEWLVRAEELEQRSTELSLRVRQERRMGDATQDKQTD